MSHKFYDYSFYSYYFKFWSTNGFMYGEVHYYFIHSFPTGYSTPLAMVSVFSQPEPALYAQSHQALISCWALGEMGLCVIPAKSVATVVAMIPHSPVVNSIALQGHFFLVESRAWIGQFFLEPRILMQSMIQMRMVFLNCIYC
jgi:hypothetical protein